MPATQHSRRKFLQNSLIASLGIPLAQLSCTGIDPKSEYVQKIGLQMYTLRDQFAKDPKSTFEAVKAAGYWQAELMNTDNLAETKKMAEDAGLNVKGAFMDWNYITGNWHLEGGTAPENYNIDNLVADAASENLEYIIFGYMRKEERDTLDKWKQLTDDLNAAGEKCKAAGVQLAYHNHSFEFENLEGKVPYELLIDRLDPELVKFELDIFWASIGGYDPVKLLDRIGDRTYLLHLKDKKEGTPVVFDEGKVPKDAYKELGRGVVDIKACMEKAKAKGVRYCHVEQDESPDPLQSIQVSRKYLS